MNQVCNVFVSLVPLDELAYCLVLANVCILALAYILKGKIDDSFVWRNHSHDMKCGSYCLDGVDRMVHLKTSWKYFRRCAKDI